MGRLSIISPYKQVKISPNLVMGVFSATLSSIKNKFYGNGDRVKRKTEFSI